jgi:hypothetical protein
MISQAADGSMTSCYKLGYVYYKAVKARRTFNEWQLRCTKSPGEEFTPLSVAGHEWSPY